MEQQEARRLAESLVHDLDTHEARPILNVIEDVEFSWTLHEANAQELTAAIAANLDPAAHPGLFDRVRREAYGRELSATTRRLANYCASACSLVDRIEAIARDESCPPRLQSALGKLRNDVSDVPAVAFFRVVRDAHLHFAPQHVAALFPPVDVVLAPRRHAKRQISRAATSYIEGCGAYGVPLARACEEQDGVLKTFTTDVTAAMRSEFARILADYRKLEAETHGVYAVAWPESDRTA